MTKLNSYNVYYKTCFVNLIVTAGLFVIAIPLFFFNLMEFPLGIALGGALSCLFYVIFGLLERRKMISTVIYIIVKTLLLAAIFVGISILYFKVGFKVFNPFMILAMYLVSTVVFVILSRKEGKNA